MPRFLMPLALAVLSAVLMALSPAVAQDAKLEKLTIGYQKYGTLIVLKTSGRLEERLKAQGIELGWAEFLGGVRLLEALNAGAVDFGTTGDSPPIGAQASGVDFVYAGVEPPSPRGVGILVPKDSPIKTVADLKGKRLAVGRGGNAHHLALRALEKAGLKTDEVTWSWLLPSDARGALLNGSVDAWSVFDPFLAAAETGDQARNIADGTYADHPNYQFFLASRKLATEHPEVVKIILEEIAKTDDLASKDVEGTAKTVSAATAIPFDAILLALGRMGYGVGPLTEEIVESQQKLADLFFKEKVIDKEIVVKNAVADIAD